MGKMQSKGGGVAIYCDMKASDSFEEAATKILALVRDAQKCFPGQRRFLYLDIDESHKKANGAFGYDAFETQWFIMTILMQNLTEVTMPLGHFGNGNQNNDIPDQIIVPQVKAIKIMDYLATMDPEGKIDDTRCNELVTLLDSVSTKNEIAVNWPLLRILWPEFGHDAENFDPAHIHRVINARVNLSLRMRNAARTIQQNRN